MRQLSQGVLPAVSFPASSVPLHEAITLGSLRRPGSNGSWGEHDGDYNYLTTCALLAALDGAGLLERAVKCVRAGGAILLSSAFPLLEAEVTCPVCGIVSVVGVFPPANRQLAAMIVHVTDDHGWTRPQIAEWVKGIEERQPTLPQSEEQPVSNELTIANVNAVTQG